MRRRPAPKMAEGWVALDGDAFEEEVILPEQLLTYEPAWTPEQNLQAAVLLDAVRCFRNGDREVDLWFQSAGEDAFSFRGVCESLGLNPAGFRRRLAAQDDA